MPLPGTDPETMLIRTTVISVALQSLIARLVSDGILDKGDLVALREIGLELAESLREHGTTAVGVRLGQEVDAWWDTVGRLAGE